MKKLYSGFSAAVLLFAPAVFAPLGRAQGPVSDTRVQSNPAGPWFEVDGQLYYNVMEAFWPVGSLHTLWAPSGQGYAYNLDGTVQWQFQSWQSPSGPLVGNPVTVIASPTVTQYTAVYNTLYQFSLQISCNSAPCSSSPGTVLVNGAASPIQQSVWETAGASLTLQAYPNPGWTFAGWQPGANQSIAGVQNIVTVNAPMALNAVFLPTKSINFATNPPDLQLYADHALITTPVTLQWGLGTSHTLGEIDVQADPLGKKWVFSSWSDGGAPGHTYTVGANSLPETITATYAAAANPLFTTVPANLNLTIDGLSPPPPYYYVWGVGSTHTVAAPVQQTDAQGNTWLFKSWDDLVTTPVRTVTVPVGADVNGFRMVALYTAGQATLSISSTVAGVPATVDGTACTTPCTVTRALGAQVHVSAPVSAPVSDGARQDLLGWSTGGAAPVAGDWVGALTAPSTSITATYHLMNRLTTAANPAGSAAWNVLPASPDGFYDSQTLVSLAVTPQPGFRFGNWSGDLSGNVPSASLAMSAPHAVMAQFSPVPYIAPSGVSNAAGATPLPGVAPGSAATIFGASLASTTVVAPAAPLPQTLAGITVHIGTRLLPLTYVSPAQINLQIPSNLALGPQTVTVSSTGMPDVSANFTVVRNAPGIFPVALNGANYALVLHEDGTLVTPDSPAATGELLTLYGTGFGPTAPVRPEGLAVPATPPYVVLDPVTIQVGPSVFTPDNAFAAPGQVGLDVVQFRLDSSVPSGAPAALNLNINGVVSNTLPLPIQ
jgi:uncharacterized protein (TIGR03437 family)